MIIFNRKGHDESFLANRIAQIIGFEENNPPHYSNGKWILNSTWWMGIINSEQASLSCSKPIGTLEGDALVIVIQWLI